MSRRERLVVVCGLPGAGKTSMSREIAERIDAELPRTDVVREDVVPDPDYTPEETRRVYDELLDRAAAAVDEHGVVVLDGTFRLKHLRAVAREEVADVGAIFELVKVECSAEVVRERITAREGDESDADFAVHELLAEEFEAVGAPASGWTTPATSRGPASRWPRTTDRISRLPVVALQGSSTPWST